MARWSVSDATIRRTSAKPKASQQKEEEDIDVVSFWPGGRLKTHGENVEAEYSAIKDWEIPGV